jgi:hypothetical protein
VRCENRDHVLGEIDFEGRAQLPPEINWAYCCNCEHFWPTNFDYGSGERCPVCQRPMSFMYLCDRCYTISFESPAQAGVKNFTVDTEGAPRPSCPGCLRSPAGVLRAHDCAGLGSSFFTALGRCPVCGAPVGDAPAFPATVAEYLGGVRADRKIRAALDYGNDLLVAAEGGEFVLVRDGNGPGQPVAVPAVTRFTSRGDFYADYQDYYHCADPSAGEVLITSPALVEEVAGGWKLREPGVLEVLKEAAAGQEVAPPPDSPAAEGVGPAGEGAEGVKPAAVCPHCGAVPEKRGYAFCWSCGKPLRQAQASPPGRTGEPRQASPELGQAAPERPEPAPARQDLFAWASEKPAPESGGAASRRRPVVIGIVALAAASLILFMLLRRPPAAAVGADESRQQGATTPAPQPLTTPAAAQAPAARPEDEELETLRERIRGGAAPSEAGEVVEALEAAEQKYPADYRFPYERAKLSIRGTASHPEAFGALLLAARKAIEGGKADEMLRNLTDDRDGDFRKLSRGHGEWARLEEALKQKDVKLLGGGNGHGHLPGR